MYVVSKATGKKVRDAPRHMDAIRSEVMVIAYSAFD